MIFFETDDSIDLGSKENVDTTIKELPETEPVGKFGVVLHNDPINRLRSRTDLSLNDIAQWLNPIMRGWIAYYGKFYRSAMYAIIRSVNKALVRWFMRKYKAIRRSKMRAMALFDRCMKESPGLFVHWREGMKGAFA